MTKTFLLFGAQGMLGAQIFNDSMDRNDIEIIPFSRFNVDVNNEEAVQKAVEKFDIDGVINTTAYTQVDKCEKDEELSSVHQKNKTHYECWKVNESAVENIVNACKKQKIPLFHFSTDYVFSGETDQKFTEDSVPNPINEYGKSKLAGEKKVLEYENGYVLRTAWLAGAYGQHFVNKMVHLSKTVKSIKIVANEMGSPSFCADVSQSLFDCILQEKLPKEKIFHLVNEGVATRKELLEEIQNFLELSTEIIPVKTFELPAPRPISSILINSKLPKLPHWKTGLHQLLKREKEKLDKKRAVEAKKLKAKEKYRAQQEKLREEKNNK